MSNAFEKGHALLMRTQQIDGSGISVVFASKIVKVDPAFYEIYAILFHPQNIPGDL